MPITIATRQPTPRVDLLGLINAGSSSSQPGEAALDLQWEPFQAHVNNFLKAIDKYATDARTEIAERVTEHTEMVRDLKASKDDRERRINVEREHEAQMLSAVEAERHTVTDLQSSLAHLEATLAKVREQSAAVEQDLNAVKAEANTEQSEKDRQRRALEEQKDKDVSELGVLEDGLGLRIQGVSRDVLLISFTLIDHANPEREFSLVVNIASEDYSVPKCDPMIPTLPELVAQLNADRSFYAFIKRARKAFRALIPEPPKPASRFDDMAGPGMRTPGSRRVLESDLAGMRLD